MGCIKWPDEELIPGFRETMETYLEEVEKLGYKFSSLLAEALGLGPKGLEHFYDTQDMMQHRGKIVKYPVITGSNDQGVGPHYDAGFLTLVCIPNSPPPGRHTYRFFISFCKPRLIEACKCRISLGNGSTLLLFQGHLLLISVKVWILVAHSRSTIERPRNLHCSF